MSDEDLPPPRRDQLSKTPSWIMLGFVLGFLVAYAVQKKIAADGDSVRTAEIEARATAVPPTPVPTPTPVPARERPSLFEIEAVFAQGIDRAVWENDLTEVAMWNVNTHAYSDFYEIMRSGGFYYFRSVSRLSRPIIGAQAESADLLRFTETDAMRAKRLEPIPPIFRPAPPKP